MTDWRRSPALPRDFSREARVYMRPTGLLSGDIADAAVEAGAARRLAGGRFAFSACEVLLREPQVITATIAPVGEVAEWADDCAIRLLETLEAPRPPMAGVAMDRPAIMGVINVTPDSFSDGGENAEEAVAIAQGRAMVEAGAAILDIGGESTRPGSDAVDDATELARV
ncbi:MAG: dihydropteroate synthase, partial [Pseudomonadota bacterium]|nr:dihydropteroate synthase [Pseudomonadota bacterium]